MLLSIYLPLEVAVIVTGLLVLRLVLFLILGLILAVLVLRLIVLVIVLLVLTLVLAALILHVLLVIHFETLSCHICDYQLMRTVVLYPLGTVILWLVLHCTIQKTYFLCCKAYLQLRIGL